MSGATTAARRTGLADQILDALRAANRSDERFICQQDGVYGDLHEALVKLLGGFGWTREQVSAAIVHAHLDGECAMADALFACHGVGQ